MKRLAVSALMLPSVWAILAVVLLLSTAMDAQVDTGSITGTVTDQSGAVVGSARVTLTNEGTGAALASTTGPDGIYKFSPVRIGTYKLGVTAQGFK